MATRFNIEVHVDSKGVATASAKSKKAFTSMGRGASAAGSRIGRLNAALASLASRMALIAPAFAILFARSAIRKFAEQEKVLKNLQSLIEATGGAAGFTTQQLHDFAGELQTATGVGDEAIEKSMGILLTFKSVTGDVFKRATSVALDMSEVIGQDTKQSMILLGKALEEPILGLSAMRRVGISFTESQKEMIKSLVEAGDKAAAQGVILDALEGQMGGVAVGARDTLAGALQQLGNVWGDLQETVAEASGSDGGFFRIAAEAWIRWISALQKNWSTVVGVIDIGISLMISGFAKLVDGLATALTFLGRLPGVADDLGAGMRDAAINLELMADAMEDRAVDAVVSLSAKIESDGRPALQGLADDANAAATAMSEIDLNLKEAKEEIARLSKEIKAAERLEGLADALEFEFPDIQADLSAALVSAVDDLGGAIEGGDWIPDAAPQGWALWWKENSGEITTQVNSALTQAFAAGSIKDAWEGLVNSMASILQLAVAKAVSGALASSAGAAAGPLGAIAGAVAGGLLSSVLAGGEDKGERARREAEEAEALRRAVEDLRIEIARTANTIAGQVLEGFRSFNDLLDDTVKKLGAAGRGMVLAIQAGIESLERLANTLLGIAPEDLGNRLQAAALFNEQLVGIGDRIVELQATLAERGTIGGGKLDEGFLPEEFRESLQAELDQALADLALEIDLSALTDQLIDEFLGVTAALDAASIRATADQLRDAVQAMEGFSLTADQVSAALERIGEVEMLRLQQLKSDALAPLLDMMIRFRVMEGDARAKQAELAEFQARLDLKIIEANLTALGVMDATIRGWIDALEEAIENFDFGALPRAPRGLRGLGGGGGGRGRGGGRKAKRRGLLDELAAFFDGERVRNFNDQMRQLRHQFFGPGGFAARAKKLGVSIGKVTAAFRAAARALTEQVFGGIRDFLQQLRSGSFGGMTLAERFSAARSRFQSLSARARGGDLEAIRQLPGAASEFLALAREMFGTGSMFQDILAGVEQTMQALLRDRTRLIDAALEGNAAVVGELHDQTERLAGLGDAQVGHLDAIRKDTKRQRQLLDEILDELRRAS